MVEVAPPSGGIAGGEGKQLTVALKSLSRGFDPGGGAGESDGSGAEQEGDSFEDSLNLCKHNELCVKADKAASSCGCCSSC